MTPQTVVSTPDEPPLETLQCNAQTSPSLPTGKLRKTNDRYRRRVPRSAAEPGIHLSRAPEESRKPRGRSSRTLANRVTGACELTGRSDWVSAADFDGSVMDGAAMSPTLAAGGPASLLYPS